MRRLAVMTTVAAFAAAVGFTVMHFWPIGKPVSNSSLEGDAGRGAYLARISGCIGCHTDSKNGGKPLTGGVAFSTDFGTFYSPNLTMDKTDGMGGWTIHDFDKAVRQGVSPNGQPYYPAFPYAFYANFSDQDIADLWAAFETVPAVSELSKKHDLGLPFSYRPGLKIWRAAYGTQADAAKPVEGKSDLWNRGRFLAEGPMHCGACHSPRNFAGARITDRKFEGSTSLPDGGKSPPITVTHLKKEGWTKDDISFALKIGILPDGDVFGSLMGDFVNEATQYMSNEDLNALSTYLMNEN